VFTLVFVGLLAGVITSISPCVLPVLPIVLTAGAARAGETGPAAAPRRGRVRSWRPYGVVAGLVLSFSLATLFGSLVLSALHLPQDLLRDAGIVVLVLMGFGLVVPRVGELLERPFARIRGRRVNPDGNGFVLGLALGLLYVPCAGPVLATIAVIGASHRIGFGAIALTAAFGVGAGIPLLVLAVAGEAITQRAKLVRAHARQVRVAAGVVMIMVAAAIGLNLTDGLQRSVPGYTTALQQSIEAGSVTSNQVRRLTGAAPELTGLNGWLNTPGNRPLSLASLRGKVVLIDFWTYSCINCQRALPHVESWYQTYQKDGLVVIGVHTPEFAFEHEISNVADQARSLGVRYPIAIDNDYATWNAYGNQYWPAEYLIDASGKIRHTNFGEGDYAGTEGLIRRLLSEADPARTLPAATGLPDTTPTEEQTPETYLGYQYAPLHVSGSKPVQDGSGHYKLPPSLEPDTFALAGSWTSAPEYLIAGADAKLALDFHARDVHIVLGGSGTVTVRLTGEQTTTSPVSGAPKLYTLVNEAASQHAVLTLSMSPGVQAYSFTFG
jgi:cytochrome c biogenesis protein CcdA/thiol-disulfide isomerase/thioredoxin